jgi:hypothetical protein
MLSRTIEIRSEVDMDSDYVQSVRYKLQKRFRRLNGADWKIFPSYVRQFWDFCTGQI